MSFLSISLDMAGSTQAKAAIRAHSAGDLANVAEQYALLAQGLYDVELRFYAQLLARGLPLESIFCVKTIGDEVWTVVQLPASRRSPRHASTVLAVVEAALAVCTRTVVSVTPDQGMSWEQAAEPTLALHLKWRHQSLPIKWYLDVVDHSADISRHRQTSFEQAQERLESELRDHQLIDITPEVRAQLLHHLSGTVYRVGDRTLTRSDFLGYEIDRFFRSTKAALPSCVTLGQNLAERIHLEPGLAALPAEHGAAVGIAPEALGAPMLAAVADRWQVVREDIPAASMKGCDGDYAVYHVWRDRDVAELRAATGRAPINIGPTLKLIEAKGLPLAR
ncbi:MAG: hypothetical protein ACYTGX_10825 [Planctomycetota bacterium]